MGIIEVSSRARNYGAKFEEENFVSKFIKPVFEKTAREER